MPTQDDIAWFWSHVERSDFCWDWTGGKTSKGYGQITFDGQRWYAHRLAHELSIGPIPEGLEIDHLCRNPSCVNPAHLEAVTHGENIRRGKRKLRCSKGHLLVGDNLDTTAGRRRCRTCHSAYETERVKAKRAEIRNAPRFCACGCGRSLSGRQMGTKWARPGCKMRVWRARKAQQ